jgi:hypothetical protein
MTADVQSRINKMSLTSLMKDNKYIFVEIDSLEPLLMDSWSISSPNCEWDDLVPLYNDNKFAWCFARDEEYFKSIGWKVDDLSRRVYKKIKKSST